MVKTFVFAEGTNRQQILDFLHETGLFKNLKSYIATIEVANTGEKVGDACCIEGDADPFVWDLFKMAWELTEVQGQYLM